MFSCVLVIFDSVCETPKVKLQHSPVVMLFLSTYFCLQLRIRIKSKFIMFLSISLPRVCIEGHGWGL